LVALGRPERPQVSFFPGLRSLQDSDPRRHSQTMTAKLLGPHLVHLPVRPPCHTPPDLHKVSRVSRRAGRNGSDQGRRRRASRLDGQPFTIPSRAELAGGTSPAPMTHTDQRRAALQAPRRAGRTRPGRRGGDGQADRLLEVAGIPDLASRQEGVGDNQSFSGLQDQAASDDELPDMEGLGPNPESVFQVEQEGAIGGPDVRENDLGCGVIPHDIRPPAPGVGGQHEPANHLPGARGAGLSAHDRAGDAEGRQGDHGKIERRSEFHAPRLAPDRGFGAGRAF
jgi:hypothetical protein